MKKKVCKACKLMICITLLLVCFSNQAYCCTIFSKQQGDIVLAGNNEDYTYSIPSKMYFVAPDKDNYGRVCFALSSYVQGGMNEKGLFYDGATCPPSQIPYYKDKPELGMDLGEVVLAKCANVQEAVEMLKDVNIPQSYTDHLMFADASGASVVLEWVKNDLKIIKKENSFQIATNYWLTYPELGGYPCERYDKVKAILQEEKPLSTELCRDALKAAAQNWGDGGTKYSNVYDLRNKDVYIYISGNFDKEYKYNLSEQIARMDAGQKTAFYLTDIETGEKLPSENTGNRSVTVQKDANRDKPLSQTDIIKVTGIAVVLVLIILISTLILRQRQKNDSTRGI